MNKVIVMLLAAVFSQAAAAAAQTVEGFLADPVAIMDAQGKQVGELPLKDAPKPPLPVLQYNEGLDQVQVELAGKLVWLDTQDLRMNPTKVVKLGCKDMKTGLPASKENNSTIGYGGCKE